MISQDWKSFKNTVKLIICKIYYGYYGINKLVYTFNNDSVTHCDKNKFIL